VKLAIVHPYPVSSRAVGGTTRVNALARFLARRHAVTVLTHASDDEEADRAAIAELASLGIEQRVFPRPRASAPRKLAWALGSSPYFVGYNRNPDLEAALVELDRSAALDAVHLEFAYLTPLLEGLSSIPARILAEQETMSVAIERLRAVPQHLKSRYQLYLGHRARSVRRFEARVLPEFDRAFAITAGEAEWLERVSGRRVGILPHVVEASAFAPPESEPEEPVALFVGNFAHDPNRHALGWLLDGPWPMVRAAVPAARLEVIGPGLPAADAEALEAANGRWLGRVEDLAAAYRRAAVFVNPIVSGGGMRGKVLEAFASARPVVSTALGMEGIAARNGSHAEIADHAPSFAAAVSILFRDPALRRVRGRIARELVVELYDAPVVFARLERDVAAAVAERRSRAATGRVA
jgi:polysaccharide biosynthesis protein PslH